MLLFAKPVTTTPKSAKKNCWREPKSLQALPPLTFVNSPGKKDKKISKIQMLATVKPRSFCPQIKIQVILVNKRTARESDGLSE